MAAAAWVTALGVVGALTAASWVAQSEAAKSRQALAASAADVASTLQLAIQREEDLMVSAGAFIAGNPDASQTEFAQWARSVRVSTRYPEVMGFARVVIVPAADLKAFAARAVNDPAGTLAADKTFQVVPPGVRPTYCLMLGQYTKDPKAMLPAGFDTCAADPSRASMLLGRDSGQNVHNPFEFNKVSLLSVLTPVYRGGVAPSTVSARQATFEGNIGMAVIPKVLLDRALQGHPATSVAMRYQLNSADVVFSSGKPPAGSESVTTDLHNGWSVQTFGVVAAGGIFGTGTALALLLTGIGLSLLLGALVFVLATGRARALRMVAERTAQLREAQAQLVDTARQAGMAEIATNVLHNVGNVLNSVNVSADLVRQTVRGSKSGGLMKAVELMKQHSEDPGFLTTDARGQALPSYLETLATTLAVEQEGVDAELARLTKGVAHIKEIVAAQQSLAGISGVVEPVRVGDLVEDALRIAGVDEDEVRVIRDVRGNPLVALDRHRVLIILLNLIANAQQAMKANGDRPRELSLRVEMIDGQGMSITVADTGVGIPQENLARIFGHGFTTHADAHGFGLHSSAVAAKEMGGELTVRRNEGSPGAAFTLQVPLDRQLVAA